MQWNRILVPALLLATPPMLAETTDSTWQQRMEAHRSFLADDLLEGRGAGTRGYDLAAAYVAAQFHRMGVAGATDDGGYLQPVELLSAQVNLEASRIVVHGAEDIALEPLNDHYVRPAYDAEQVEIRAPAVFIGFGVHAPELDHDDLAGVDLEGKIAVILAGAPEQFPVTARAHYSRRKYDEIERRGAVGMIYLYKPDDAQRVPWAVALGRARFARMRLIDTEGEIVDGLPGIRASAVIRSGGGKALFSHAPRNLRQVYAAAKKGEVQSFPLDIDVTLGAAATFDRASSANVIGVLPGTDPELAGRPVVITSHLDHLGIGPERDGDTIYNGAFDNATGIAIMLAIAEDLAAQGGLARPVLFAAVTAEEKGLLGSLHLARHPPSWVERYAANLNVDMTLLLAPVRQVIARGDIHSTLGADIRAIAAEQGYDLLEDPMPEEVIFVRSDQYSFIREGVPSLYISAGLDSTDPEVDLRAMEKAFRREHYHQPSDDLSLEIDWPSAVGFAQLFGGLIERVARESEDPVWLADDFFGRIYNGPMQE
jgi:hypothetical protein